MEDPAPKTQSTVTVEDPEPKVQSTVTVIDPTAVVSASALEGFLTSDSLSGAGGISVGPDPDDTTIIRIDGSSLESSITALDTNYNSLEMRVSALESA